MRGRSVDSRRFVTGDRECCPTADISKAVSVDDAARIDRAHREAFARPATRDEVAIGERYLESCRKALAEAGVAENDRPSAAWASYARVLMSSNAFVFVD